jgi:protein SERAC1
MPRTIEKCKQILQRKYSENKPSGASSESYLPISFPDGVKVLFDSPNVTLDICFVHGLTGNRESAWTADKQSTPWPETLLPAKLSGARIITYGYDAYVSRKRVASSNGLTEHAKNLVNDLTTDRASCNALHRPLIFVTHSLGGLVCKEAILLSRNNPESHLQSIFDCAKGIVFMGTPHKGSWMADWAKIPATALGLVKSTNKTLLKVLETDNQYLKSIQDRFWSMIREFQEAGRDFEITCFFEELPLPIVGTVVSKDSAILEGYSSFSIHADHRNMVQFGSTEDNGFKRLVGELIRWESQIRNSATSQPTRPIEEAQIDKLAASSFINYGSGLQFNAPRGTQNNNTGSGNQFLGSFSGPVHFS